MRVIHWPRRAGKSWDADLFPACNRLPDDVAAALARAEEILTEERDILMRDLDRLEEAVASIRLVRQKYGASDEPVAPPPTDP